MSTYVFDKKVKELKEVVKALKLLFPLYTPIIQLEYQLDEDNVVVNYYMPYSNKEDSDVELVKLLCIIPKKVYPFLKAVEDLKVNVIIIDTTEGDYFHELSLEETLKEYANKFTPFNGRGWETKEPTCKDHGNFARVSKVVDNKESTVELHEDGTLYLMESLDGEVIKMKADYLVKSLEVLERWLIAKNNEDIGLRV